MQEGIIARFDPDLQYGYIHVPRGSRRSAPKDVFFNGARRRVFLGLEAGKPMFRMPARTRKLRRAIVDSKVVFERGRVNNRDQVLWWSFVPSGQSPLVANLRMDRTYRVVVQDKRAQDPASSDPPEIWTGTDLFELSVRYPLPSEGRPDPLDFGVFTGHAFMILRKEGWMLEHKDPRVPLCCVPAASFEKERGDGASQPICYHRTAA